MSYAGAKASPALNQIHLLKLTFSSGLNDFGYEPVCNHKNSLDIKSNYFILQISSAGKSQNFHINISGILILIFTLENYGKQMGL